MKRNMGIITSIILAAAGLILIIADVFDIAGFGPERAIGGAVMGGVAIILFALVTFILSR